MLQYERPGAVGVRVDLGYLATPFGLGMMDTRPGVEETVGYRLTTDLTLRGSLYQRKTFTRSDWDQQAGVSLVWARRWW